MYSKQLCIILYVTLLDILRNNFNTVWEYINFLNFSVIHFAMLQMIKCFLWAYNSTYNKACFFLIKISHVTTILCACQLMSQQSYVIRFLMSQQSYVLASSFHNNPMCLPAHVTTILCACQLMSQQSYVLARHLLLLLTGY